MKYQLIFSDELKENAEAFVREWNAMSESENLPMMTLEKPVGEERFLPVDQIVAVLQVAGEILEQGKDFVEPAKELMKDSVVTGVIFEAIKRVFKRLGFSVSIRQKNSRLYIDHLPLKK